MTTNKVEVPVPKSVTEGSKNLWTSITGAIVGVGYYISTVGPQMPTTRLEWINLIVALAAAALGIGAKDAAAKK